MYKRQVGGDTQEEHDERLLEVLRRLEKYNVTVNFDKCEFSVPTVRFLGQKLSKEGISMDESKIEAIANMTPPSNVPELRRFLGIVNQVSKFVPHLAYKTEPLRVLLKKNVLFKWSAVQ